jgi:hypothetical protein
MNAYFTRTALHRTHVSQRSAISGLGLANPVVQNPFTQSQTGSYIYDRVALVYHLLDSLRLELGRI